MTGTRADTLLASMFFIERFTLNRSWDGLTDDEMHWEPHPGAWGVHPNAETRTPTPFVCGDWSADFDNDLAMASITAGPTEPMTTVAWLYWHVGSIPERLLDLDFLGGNRHLDDGWTSPYVAKHPIFATADEAVTTMRSGWAALGARLRDATDDQLEAPQHFYGYGGPPPPTTGAYAIAAALNEISHHMTQVGAIRDLYRFRT